MSALSACGWMWVAWVVIWIIAAYRTEAVKWDEGLQAYQYSVPGYFALWAVFHNTQPPLGPWISFLWQNEKIGWAGAVLAFCGHVFGCWARWHIGRNWSGAVALKQNHKLVDTGPYRLVRHPIYTGLFMSAFGSVMAAGTVEALLSVLLLIPVYTVKCLREQQVMVRQFGAKYEVYRKRTKAIIPYLL